MDKNVLIKFTADTGGLDEATQKLDALTDRERELLKQIELLKREQQAAQMMAKNADEQTKATQKYGDKVAAARKELIQTRKSIEEVAAAQKELEKTVAKGVVEKSFRTVRMELQEQLKQMRMNGQAGTEEYNKLIAKLGEMNKTQRAVNAEMSSRSSITYTFDSIMKGAQLATGAYSVLSAAQSAFGSENKDLQKTMATLQTAMTASIGVQQLYTASVGAGGVIQRVMTLQTKARTAAELASTKGTIGATIAQKAFNIVANANPYILLATALITVVGALYIFASGTESAAEKQKKLNELVKESIDLKQQYGDELKKRAQESINALQREYDLMKAGGASEAQLALKSQQIADQRIKNANAMAGYYEKEITNIDKNKAAVDKYTQGLSNMNNAIHEAQKKGLKKTTFMFDGKVQKIDISEKAIEAARDVLQRGLNISSLRLNQGREALDEQKKAEAEAEKTRKEAAQKAAEAGRRSAIAMAEYNVLMAKKGSQEELKAQIEAANVKLRSDLANVNITKGERLKRTKETLLSIEKLENDYRISRLNDELDLIDAGLSATKENSEEEYQYKLKQFEKQRQIALQTQNLTNNEITKINADFDAKVRKQTEDRAKYQSQVELNITRSSIEGQLAEVAKGSDRELELKIQLLQAEANENRIVAQNEIQDEEEKAVKIQEINAKLQKEITDIRLASAIDRINKETDRETLAVTQRYEQGKLSKWEYEASLNDITLSSLEKEIAERKKNGEDTIDLEQKQSEKRIEIAQKEAELKKALQEELFNTVTTIGSSIFEGDKERIQQELKDFQHYYTTDAEEAKKNKDLKLITQEEYNKRELALKQKAAKVEKEQAIFSLVLTQTQAIARVFKDFPWPLNLAIASLMGVQTLIQINKARSQSLPKYWKGRKNGQGEFALAGEYGPEIMWIPKGASIMPSHDTQKAMSGDMSVMSKWNMPQMGLPRIEPNYIPPTPHIPQYIIDETRRNAGNKGGEIDYDKLGRAVAKYRKSPKEKPIKINFDKDGLTVTRGNTTTKYLNGKYRN